MDINAIQERAQEQLRKHYSKGLQDGSRMVLERLTGEHPEGPTVVNDEVRTWAATCLGGMD